MTDRSKRQPHRAAAVQKNVRNLTDNSIDSDSDNSDGTPDYYQPISSHEGESNEPSSNGYHIHDDQPTVENGMGYLDVGEDGNRESEEEEEERRRAEADVAMRRAFEEDESRRNAPLTEENATRVIEAMRGISFSGLGPDWAGQVSEDRLFGQLRRLTTPPRSAS